MRVWEAGTCTCPYACTRMERELCGHLEADRLCCAAQRLSVARRGVLARGRDGGAAGTLGCVGVSSTDTWQTACKQCPPRPAAPSPPYDQMRAPLIRDALLDIVRRARFFRGKEF